MKKNNKEAKNTMRDEYDFSKGVRGKHYKGYREGHTVVINKDDGTQSIQYFKELKFPIFFVAVFAEPMRG